MDSINADQREVQQFDDLASRWWDPQSEFAPLHHINPLRLGYIDERVRLDGRTILDVGCGGGLLSEAMAASGGQVTGIDLATQSLDVARLHLLESGLEVDYREIAAEALAEAEPQRYDVVVCMEMLEHVPDPESVVRACARLVRPGGDVFFSTINRNPKSFLFAIIGAEYLLRLLPRGTHDFQRFIRPAELGRWSERYGLAVRDLTGLHYDPLRRHYSLGPGVEVNYLMHCCA